jgi:2-amino-4-hydroxy-6-hydroxymethyldihydropteridine diphosphokinase
MKQHKVYLGLGSNIRPEHFLPTGLDELATLYGPMDVSCVYEGTAIGFEGPKFHNLVVGLVTNSPLTELAPCLRALEFRHGRDPQGDKFSSRTLDIDILTFDNYAEMTAGIVLPREEITRNAFVLRPFAEIAPDLVIPGQTQNLAAL